MKRIICFILGHKNWHWDTSYNIWVNLREVTVSGSSTYPNRFTKKWCERCNL